MDENKIQIFEVKKIRTAWNQEEKDEEANNSLGLNL